MSGTVTVNLDGLNQLAKSLRVKKTVQVGIFGNDNARDEGKETNSSIGFRHEFGVGVPQRSFLRMPITAKKGKITDTVARRMTAEQYKVEPLELFNNIGSACLRVIADSFASNGFGTWPALAYSTLMARLRNRYRPRRWMHYKKMSKAESELNRRALSHSVDFRKQQAGQHIESGAGGDGGDGHVAILQDTMQLKKSITWRVV